MNLENLQISTSKMIGIAISVIAVGVLAASVTGVFDQASPTMDENREQRTSPTDSNNSQEQDASAEDNVGTDEDSSTDTDQFPEIKSKNDNQLTGEPHVEEYLSNQVSGANKKAGREATDWVEFEDPNQQMNFPKWDPDRNGPAPDAAQFMYWAEQGQMGERTNVKEMEFDSVYFGVNEDEEYIVMAFLDPDTYNPEVDVDDNLFENDEGLYITPMIDLDEYTPERAFSEVVKDYSDVSENFPREYFEAIEG